VCQAPSTNVELACELDDPVESYVKIAAIGIWRRVTKLVVLMFSPNDLKDDVPDGNLSRFILITNV